MYNDYYNYLNNNYNVPVYNQPKGKMLFNPYQGFIRGNMFPDLYNFYKVEFKKRICSFQFTYRVYPSFFG